MPLAKTVSPWKESPQLKPFVAQDFLKHIERAGPQLTSGLKGDWVGLYRQVLLCRLALDWRLTCEQLWFLFRRFLSSHNFNTWLVSRRTEINQRLQLVHLDAISQAVSLSSMLVWSRCIPPSVYICVEFERMVGRQVGGWSSWFTDQIERENQKTVSRDAD